MMTCDTVAVAEQVLDIDFDIDLDNQSVKSKKVFTMKNTEENNESDRNSTQNRRLR